MKYILSFLLLLPIVGLTQEIDSTISKEQFESLTCKFYRTTKEGRSTYYVACSFQNRKYEHITDIGVIIIPNQLTLDSLISDIEGVCNYFETETTVKYYRGMYSICHYDFSPDFIYIEDRRGKYTMLDSYNTKRFLAWLKTIKFP